MEESLILTHKFKEQESILKAVWTACFSQCDWLCQNLNCWLNSTVQCIVCINKVSRHRSELGNGNVVFVPELLVFSQHNNADSWVMKLFYETWLIQSWSPWMFCWGNDYTIWMWNEYTTSTVCRARVSVPYAYNNLFNENSEWWLLFICLVLSLLDFFCNLG